MLVYRRVYNEYSNLVPWIDRHWSSLESNFGGICHRGTTSADFPQLSLSRKAAEPYTNCKSQPVVGLGDAVSRASRACAYGLREAGSDDEAADGEETWKNVQSSKGSQSFNLSNTVLQSPWDGELPRAQMGSTVVVIGFQTHEKI